jgi:predicted secreted hydrolase
VSRRHSVRRGALLLIVASLVGACGGAPILANPALVAPVPPTRAPTPTHLGDPLPVQLPEDDGPHDRLTEWWYYTGHLVATDGRHFGFEAVIFRAERGDVPTTWASHLALTDESGNRFLYAQRSQVGIEADHSPRDALGRPTGFALGITGFDPGDPGSLLRAPWVLAGSDGHDHIAAALSAKEASTAGGAFGLTLDLEAERPPALHMGNGWIDFGPAGSSYYYSRTRMAVAGSLDLDGETLAVTGIGWFDHQWGDFISVGGGGWDWFAVELADGRDLTISMVRGADGSFPLVYGTLVEPPVRRIATSTVNLGPKDFTVRSTGTWTSPRTGAIYPAGWVIEVPSQQLQIRLSPTVADQELDTRPSTGVVYWEGSQRVSATSFGRSIGGEAYVELTGYAPATP